MAIKYEESLRFFELKIYSSSLNWWKKEVDMSRVICAVSEGLRPAEATVMVKDFHGRQHFLPIDRGMLSSNGGHSYLPVALVFIHDQSKAALVELPLEADSGFNRVWVNLEQLSPRPEVRP
jgi:hypothetical protein